MKYSQIYDRLLRKIGVKSSTVPVLCHGCGRMIGIPRDQIQFIELGDSPCCGAMIAPPPKHTEKGKIWDEFGGERLMGEDNPEPDIDPEEAIESMMRF